MTLSGSFMSKDVFDQQGCRALTFALARLSCLDRGLSLTQWMILRDVVYVCVFAGHRLMTLIDLEPDNEKIYFNLGLLSMDDKKFNQAKAWYDKAIKVSLGILVMFLWLTSPKSWLFRWTLYLQNITTIRTLFHKRCRTNWSIVCVQLGVIALSWLALKLFYLKRYSQRKRIL